MPQSAEDVRLHERKLRLAWSEAFETRDLLDVITALYHHEVNVGMQAFWDGGLDVWLGSGAIHGFPDSKVAEQHFEPGEFGGVASWLIEAAEAFYPMLRKRRMEEAAQYV